MKNYLPVTITLFIPIILFSQSLSHQGNLFNVNTFKVIDIQNISVNYMILTCRNDIGKTIQFITGSSQSSVGKSAVLSLGTTIIAGTGLKTVSPLSDTTIKYNILRPVFSNQCCFISAIERNKNDSVDFVIAKTDTASGLTYFRKKILKDNSPNIILAIKQPIYQMLFNNKRYAALKSLDEREVNNNIFYSYELNFITRKSYNAFLKRETNNKLTTSNKEFITRLPRLNSFRIDTFVKKSGQSELSNILYGQNMTIGTLNILVPVNVDYGIKIYTLPDHIEIYNTNEQRNFLLLPGVYDLEISGVVLKNILVYKGVDTRIKAGTLNVPYNIPWVLYDENKIKKVYSSSLGKKVVFPKGIYQLEINGLLHSIEIKDGEMMQYDSTKYMSQKLNVSDLNDKKIVKNEVIKTLIDEKKWEIKKCIRGYSSRIFLDILKETECITTIFQSATGKEVHYSGALTNERSFSLTPGTYDINISGSLAKDVPVQKAMETRIKAGILNVVGSGMWTLYDDKKSTQIYFSPSAKKIGLPIGIYQIEINGKIKKIIIKDGETLQL